MKKSKKMQILYIIFAFTVFLFFAKYSYDNIFSYKVKIWYSHGPLGSLLFDIGQTGNIRVSLYHSNVDLKHINEFGISPQKTAELKPSENDKRIIRTLIYNLKKSKANGSKFGLVEDGSSITAEINGKIYGYTFSDNNDNNKELKELFDKIEKIVPIDMGSMRYIHKEDIEGEYEILEWFIK